MRLVTSNGVPYRVSKRDLCLVSHFTWQADANHYIYTIIDNRLVLLHRLLISTSLEIDHKNRNPSDNRRKNLRTASRTQNCFNTGVKKTNTSGYKGVHTLRNGKYRARLRYKGKEYNVLTDTAKEAAKAYDKLVKSKLPKSISEFAYLNSP